MAKKTAPYGTWQSPITADAILETPPHIEELIVDPVTSTIYHIESRPLEGGRNVLVETENGKDVVGKEWNVRTKVHEYGGAPAVAYGGAIYFSNFADNRVYVVQDGKEPEAVTPDKEVHRFARFAVHPKYPHLLVCILEDHTKPAPPEVVTTLCLINTQKKTVKSIVSGADFYGSPCFTPDGTHIAWQQWFHPDMPWEGAEIYVAKVSADEDGLTLSNMRYVAGKKKEVSTGYPFWANNDLLLFTNDESGYQNPWKYTLSSGKAFPVLPKPVTEDFSEPMWQLGFDFGAPLDLEGSRAMFLALRDGRLALYIVTLKSGALEEIPSPYVSGSVIKHVTSDIVAFVADSTTDDQNVVICSLKDYSKPAFAAVSSSASSTSKFPVEYISIAQPKTLLVPPQNEPVHVVYYPPTHPEYEGAKDEQPPCVVNIHGGPTGIATQGLDWKKQYFTSRGFAYVDVNYGGSSGYGRKYIERLANNWGVIDIQDSVAAIEQLSKLKLIDTQRTAIRGQSAGGFTTLATLCFAPHAVTAGCSLFGVADLTGLANETHKFESHYLFKLVGGTPDEVPEVYKARSPLYHADKIRAPLLVLQGDADAVVPPNQAKGIVETVRKQGGRVDFVLYKGEGHGWRRDDTIKDALEKELAFYQDVFGLKA